MRYIRKYWLPKQNEGMVLFRVTYDTSCYATGSCILSNGGTYPSSVLTRRGSRVQNWPPPATSCATRVLLQDQKQGGPT